MRVRPVSICPFEARFLKSWNPSQASHCWSHGISGLLKRPEIPIITTAMIWGMLQICNLFMEAKELQSLIALWNQSGLEDVGGCQHHLMYHRLPCRKLSCRLWKSLLAQTEWKECFERGLFDSWRLRQLWEADMRTYIYIYIDDHDINDDLYWRWKSIGWLFFSNKSFTVLGFWMIFWLLQMKGTLQ